MARIATFIFWVLWMLSLIANWPLGYVVFCGLFISSFIISLSHVETKLP